MAVIPLQSGSNGNCIYVESAGTRLLIDAGISGIRAESRLAECGCEIRSVDAVLLTHDHVDHSKNLGVYHRKYGLPVWAPENTFRAAEYVHNIGVVQEPHFFRANTRSTLRKLTIEAIRTPHDAVEGVVFVIDNGAHRLGVLTDLGHVFPRLPELIESLDAVVIESNHDVEMLRNCEEYPEYLKQRIRGKGGHLSNREAAGLLRHSGHRLRWACLAHLSEKANRPEVALEEHRRMLRSDFNLFVARRDGCSQMMTL
jgi:phosphoribosyl 1,2-cyclic phosphodiesterase